MSSKWKILAAIDLMRSSESDVHYAVSVASALRAEVHLLYVTEGGSSDPHAYDWPANAFKVDYGESVVHRAVLQGETAETIARYADSIDADVIVMASRRYGRWTRFWRRSVTESVMRLSRRPVLIHSKTSADGDFTIRNRRLLCVPALERPGETALTSYAELIAARSNSDIILLHIVPEPSEALLHYAADGGARPLSRERAAVDLAGLARTLTQPATTSVMVGHPEKCIGSAAWEHSVDLVLVSRGSERSRAVYDTNLAGVWGRLRCPLLTISVDAPVFVNGHDEIRSGMRHRKAVSATVAAIKERGDGAYQFHEAPAQTVQNTLVILTTSDRHNRAESRDLGSRLSRLSLKAVHNADGRTNT